MLPPIQRSHLLQDSVKPDALETIKALRSRSIEVSILTGDNSSEADRISQELGIPVAASGATPDEKLRHVKMLQQKGHKVIMVRSLFCMSYNPRWFL